MFLFGVDEYYPNTFTKNQKYDKSKGFKMCIIDHGRKISLTLDKCWDRSHSFFQRHPNHQHMTKALAYVIQIWSPVKTET